MKFWKIQFLMETFFLQFGCFMSTRCCWCPFGINKRWRSEFSVATTPATNSKVIIEQTIEMTVIHEVIILFVPSHAIQLVLCFQQIHNNNHNKAFTKEMSHLLYVVRCITCCICIITLPIFFFLSLQIVRILIWFNTIHLNWIIYFIIFFCKIQISTKMHTNVKT